MSTHCVVDSEMDKKSARRQSSTPTVANADIKKEASGGGYNGRYRRETNTRPDMQPYRRSASQRGRPMDRRARARGVGNEYQRCEVAEEERVEHGSALFQGSRKGNLNHLLNFTFTPREGASGRGYAGRGGGGGRSFVRRTSKYNKEQFLQANCQFVVQKNADYSVHAVDPDVLVQWHLIEQVRVVSHTPTCCPICLFPPTAAKMTRCGHIYCLSCVLHYLSLSEKTWHKCPICYESVYKDDLKSVTTVEVHRYAPGELITMNLMKRSRGAMAAFPRMQWSVTGMHLNVADGLKTCYSKLLTATSGQVMEVIEAEERALQLQLSEDSPQSLEASFTQAAIDLVKKRKNLLADVATMMNTLTMEKMRVSPGIAHVSSDPCIMVHSPRKQAVVEYSCAFMDKRKQVETDEESSDNIDEKEGLAEELPEGAIMEKELLGVSKDEQLDEVAEELKAVAEPTEDVEDLEVHGEQKEGMEAPSSSAIPGEETSSVKDAENLPIVNEVTQSPRKMDRGASNSDEYYFYQAADGQHIYLHSLNARCVGAQYGCLEDSPDTITATILQLDALSMTEELRRRLRYMNHLPLTCQFEVVELDLKPPLLSSKTLLAFKGKIDSRRRQRDEKCRDEKRHSRRIDEEENRKMGIYPSMRMHLGSQRHFPQNSFEEEPARPVQAQAPVSPSKPATSPTGSDDAGSSWGKSENVSFAQMLRGGTPQTAPNRAWPTTATANLARDSDGEEKQTPPTYQASFGDAIQQALDNYGQAQEIDDSVDGKKRKKKKKVPKKLLFATTMARSK